jgi:hypothetical protein
MEVIMYTTVKLMAMGIVLLFSDIALGQCLPGHGEDMVWIKNPIAMRTPLGSTVTYIRANRLMRKPLVAALVCIRQNNLEAFVHTFDGAYCYRNIAGTNRLSAHASGMAIDLNARWNRRGNYSTLHPGIVTCFKEAGFKWGGDWKHKDAMHFEYPERKIK